MALPAVLREPQDVIWFEVPKLRLPVALQHGYRILWRLGQIPTTSGLLECLPLARLRGCMVRSRVTGSLDRAVRCREFRLL